MRHEKGTNYDMGSVPHLLCSLLFISTSILCSFNIHVMAGAHESIRDRLEISRVEKVSGADEGREMAMLLDRFRLLLGLKSHNMRRSFDPHHDHVLSPAPAPAETLAPAPAPAPSPLISKHSHHHAPSPHLKLNLPPPRFDSQEEGRGQSKSRARRVVIALAASIGSTFTLVGLVVALFCCRCGRSKLKGSSRSKLFAGFWGGRGKTRTENPPNSTNKVSFDPGPDLFYLNALRTFPEQVPCGKQTSCPVANVASKDSPSNTTVHETGESDRVSSNSVEEIHPLEPPHSSDNESFHSVCDSNSSSARFSNASETNLSNLSMTSSRSHVSRRSASLDDNSIDPTRPLTHYCASDSSEPVPTTATDLSPPVASNKWPSPTHFLSGSPLQKQLEKQDPPAITQEPNLPPSNFHTSCPPSISLQRPSQSFLTQSSASGSTPTPPCPPPPPPLPTGYNSVLLRPPAPPAPPPPPPPPVLPAPLLKSRNAVQPPPPPPYQGQQSPPVGKDGSPLPKLKPLHWDKVRATPDRSMVWDKLRSSSFELDEEMIESLFGYNLKNSMKNEEAKSKSPSPSKHVLDPKRLQNITILSKALNASAEQVCNALLQGNGLCAQQLEALVKMVPTKEEEEKLSAYQGSVDELGSAEKFVMAVLQTPFAFQRIEAMLYRDSFEDEVVHLRKSFAMLEEACKELRSSRLFLKLLEAVLKTGNRMNVGTIRGDARAFKLDALLKLADVKGANGKTTLLHFVVQEMIRSEGIGLSENMKNRSHKNGTRPVEDLQEEEHKLMGLDLVSGLGTELDNVKKTATIDLDVLASSVSNLSNGMLKLQHLALKDLAVDYNQNRAFINSMKVFIDQAEKDIKELKVGENRVMLQVREITEYFHGDVCKDEANPLRIFVIVRDFLGMLDRVCKEVRSLRTQSSPNAAIPFRAW